MVRLLVESDLPWLHRLFHKRYPNHCAFTTERYFRQVLCKDAENILAIRTSDAFLVAMRVVLPWIPQDPEVNVVAICADDTEASWQVTMLLRKSIEWARLRNAARWRLTSDTAYDVWPLAKRVGAREIRPRYELDLRGE